MPEDIPMSLTQLTAWMAEQGVVRSRAEWYRRVRSGIGRKYGTQWMVTRQEAQALLESLRPKDS